MLCFNFPYSVRTFKLVDEFQSNFSLPLALEFYLYDLHTAFTIFCDIHKNDGSMYVLMNTVYCLELKYCGDEATSQNLQLSCANILYEMSLQVFYIVSRVFVFLYKFVQWMTKFIDTE